MTILISRTLRQHISDDLIPIMMKVAVTIDCDTELCVRGKFFHVAVEPDYRVLLTGGEYLTLPPENRHDVLRQLC